MTNYEKIKNMNIDEMTDLLMESNCSHCIYNNLECYNIETLVGNNDCELGIKEWLKQEQ